MDFLQVSGDEVPGDYIAWAGMSLLRIERDGDIAVITITRPPANALNLAVVEETVRVLDALGSQASAPALVFTGMGAFFSAGVDLKEVPTYGPDEQRRMVDGINRVFRALYGYRRPVVAAVNGHALGGGLVLTLATDYRVATAAPCKIGLREVRVGVPFPVGAFEVVRGELSPGAARRIALLARDLDPAAALAEGAVDELVRPESVLPRALDVVRELATLPAEAFAITKRELRREALARMTEAIETGNDPLLRSWLPAGTETVAKSVLGISSTSGA
jgi:enoyl-CoA hydratase